MFLKKLFLIGLVLLCWDVQALNQYEAEQQLGFKQILCNECTTYDSFENVALASTNRNGILVVSNMETGGQKAFEFIREQEPDYVLTYVNEVAIPNIAQAALTQYRNTLTSMVAASGGSYLNYRTPNIPVMIPSSINGIPTSSASRPFKYVEGSARDSNGQPICSAAIGGGGESYAFSGGSFSGISGSCELWSFPDGTGGRYIMEMNCNFFC
jgi:hypothetical protein